MLVVVVAVLVALSEWLFLFFLPARLLFLSEEGAQGFPVLEQLLDLGLILLQFTEDAEFILMTMTTPFHLLLRYSLWRCNGPPLHLKTCTPIAALFV